MKMQEMKDSVRAKKKTMKVLKVVILGAEKVGKSLLLDQFLKANDPMQKGSDCSSSKDVYNVNGKTIRFPGNNLFCILVKT